MELSLVIPAYNEEVSLPEVVRLACTTAKNSELEQFEIVIVDDGSRDATGGVADALAAADPHAKVLHHPRRLGLGRALQSGFAAASFEYVTWIPGDAQFHPAETLRLLDVIGDADIVLSDVRPLGWRHPGSFGRLALSRGLRLVSRALVRGLTTYTGLLVFRRRVLHGMTLRSSTGVVNFELIHKALRAGGTVKRADFYVHVSPRVVGHSKVANASTIVRHFLDLLRLRFDS